MGRRTFYNAQAQSSALPTGGRTGELAGTVDGRVRRASQEEKKTTWQRGGPKLVDDTTVMVDRNKAHIARRDQPDSYKMFTPLGDDEIHKSPIRAELCRKSLHADPFSEGRPELRPRPSHKKLKTPRGVENNRRMVKSAPPPKDALKPGFISANGLVHVGPKRVMPQKFEVTHDKEQPPRDYTNFTRFVHSPDKAEAVHPHPAPKTAEEAEAAKHCSPHKISNAMVDDVKMLAGIPQHELPPEGRRVAKKIELSKHREITMEGVLGVPMRGGKPPKPSATAPWMKETENPVAGRRPITQPTKGTPFAVEW